GAGDGGGDAVRPRRAVEPARSRRSRHPAARREAEGDRRTSRQNDSMMTRRVAALAVFLLTAAPAAAADGGIGIVGTDTSHVTAFTQMLNDPASPDHIAGARVVAAYRGGSPDLPESRNRIDGFTRTLQEKYGVELVGTIAELCQRVDGVMLASVDGRVHLAQAREIIAARKPLFIDKPLASTLADAREIARLAVA